MDWTRLLDRLQPGLFFAVAVGALILLFRPEWFDLEPTLGGYRVWIAAACVVASLLLVAHVAGVVYVGICRARRERRRIRQSHREQERRIEALHSIHREQLARFFVLHQQSLPLTAFDDGISDLVRQGILRRGASVVGGYHRYMYTMADWAWETLHRRPELIALELRALADFAETEEG